MSSSSSDSEDEVRYRDTCDPNMFYSYERSQEQGDQGSCNIVFNLGRIADCSFTRPTETRESFVLYQKIQEVLSTGSVYNNCQNKRQLSCGFTMERRKRNSQNSNDLPSNLSPYLAKYLVKLLEERVKVEQPDCSLTKSAKITSRDDEILLLRNVGMQSIIDNKDVLPNQRISVHDNHNEKELFLRCQSVALSPEFILDKKSIHPWPHPKNIRYLESYIIKSKNTDGSCEVVPLSDKSIIEGKEKIRLEKTLK